MDRLKNLPKLRASQNSGLNASVDPINVLIILFRKAKDHSAETWEGDLQLGSILGTTNHTQ